MRGRETEKESKSKGLLLSGNHTGDWSSSLLGLGGRCEEHATSLAPALPREGHALVFPDYCQCPVGLLGRWEFPWRCCEGTLGGHELWEAGLRKGEWRTHEAPRASAAFPTTFSEKTSGCSGAPLRW